MKQLTIIFLFSLKIFFVNAQKEVRAEVNYLNDYHPMINAAEKSVMDDNYRAALEAYQKAFAVVPKAFMKDYFNAAVCAAELGDKPNTYKYLSEIANKGISLDFIKDEPAFKAIQEDAKWRDFEKQYLIKKRTFEGRINGSVKEQLNRMVERSQRLRAKNAEFSADSVKKNDAQNATELNNLIDKFGFPDEELIGCGEGGMPLVLYDFYAIIRRQTPDNQTVNFSNKILEAMQQGKISPHAGTYLLASINKNDAFLARYVFKLTTNEELTTMKNKPFSPKLEKWVYPKLTPDDERNLDELRLKNGLETMADYRKKVIFSMKDHRFLFPYKAFASTWYVTNPEIAGSYLQNTAVLEE